MKRSFSLISKMHFLRLGYRSALFIWALVTWIANPIYHKMTFAEGVKYYKLLFAVIWIVFALEMALRYFPSPTESTGCQKQFPSNFIPTEKSVPDRKKTGRGVRTVAVSWLILNGIIALLHFLGVISDGILLLIALFYSICDMICILFYCPFQTLMMKNRCCSSCRIYNWDYIMMFTPLIMIRSTYTFTLVILAAGLFIKWEYTAHKHPERFSVETNKALSCSECKEKLCHHKSQLHSFWKKEMCFRQNGEKQRTK